MLARENPHYIGPKATQEELDAPNGYQIRKQEYLDLRCNGFTEREASLLSGFTANSIRRERANDSSFEAIEKSIASVPERQTYLMRIKYTAAIAHALKEKELAVRALDPETDGLDGLSEREFSYHMETRKSLPRGQLEVESGGSGGSLNLTINLGENEIKSVEARRAVAQQLLSDFDASSKYRNSDLPLIGGEIVEDS